MCKKLSCLLSFIMVLSFINNASAVQWTGLGGDNLWNNPANWEGNKVPTAADDAMIESPESLNS